jgi:hypothetical protein
MNTAILLADLTPEFAALVPQVVDDINRKLKTAQKPPIQKEDLTWSYNWCMGMNGHGSRLNSLFVVLQGALGQRKSSAKLSSQNKSGSTPIEFVPEQVKAYYKETIWTAENFPHVATFTLVSNGSKKTILVTGGYVTKSGVFLLHIEENSTTINTQKPFETLLKIENSDAIWSGALVTRAEKKYKDAQPGTDFTYSNTKFRKMTPENIQSLVGGKTLTFKV